MLITKGRCEMSKKTLTELATQRVLDARAGRAEAAELAVEAWLAWCALAGV